MIHNLKSALAVKIKTLQIIHDEDGCMLVLTRLLEEEIIIIFQDKRVKIKVLSVDNRKVSLGFKADLDVSIIRSELEEEDKKNLLAASAEAK